MLKLESLKERKKERERKREEENNKSSCIRHASSRASIEISQLIVNSIKRDDT